MDIYDYSSSGQLSFIAPGYIKDADCTVSTPVRLGTADKPVYGMGKSISPRVPGRKGSKHFDSIYLDKLMPLEAYDLIIVLFSGGKDSMACYYKLLELGVPKAKIELWHHDIDGGHLTRRMDWRCTQNYVRSFAEAEEVTLRISYRVNGFFGELYRIGASEPIEWIDPETGEIMQCKLSQNYLECRELKEKCAENMEDALKQYGYRMKFPAKSGDLSRRWCSAYLKIMVADSVISNLDRLEQLGELGGKKILVVSGERRGESAGRARYNEMEIHRTNAEKRSRRIVHQWRPVIDYSEKDVWEVLKRHNANPHPCYRAGWNRCSCAQCIFSTPKLFAGIRELYPEEYQLLKQDEIILGFTLDNKCDLDTFVGDAKSCVSYRDVRAIENLITGEFTPDEVYVKDAWMYPAGAFRGSEGGPC
ncbi:MAG: phosphoadenosine phosphosulfate reductase family protein [Firmicutes bacterium]|nr:phosphoadenosine phosphosulfate reductase family protein [Bacillota bacterium]